MASFRSARNQAFAALMVMVLGASALAGWDWWTVLPPDAPLRYVGRQSCISCHQAEANLWTGSHHDLAMDEATPATVLGDFRDATLTHHGVTSRMFRREDGYFVHTEGPDGQMADFRVKYVLGVAPLQQYMVEFDRRADHAVNELSRLQVLRISWDTAAQRWFHLDPPDVREKLAPDDDLHWTGILQRWNNMCADCHSTNLQRRFDPQEGRYRTTFSEIDVSCEACHGPGNLHVELATATSLFWDRKRGYGLAALKGDANGPEIEACAPCHSRRAIVSPHHRPGEPYYDGYHNERLGDLTYHADGQILDEVYEYGSFTQSKMYHKGIKCSNCHDPHSLRLRHPDNKLCTSCHAHPAGKYDGPGHHHHQPGTAGAQCVNCHMPATTYMAVDPRRDHSLRVPRPSLSVDLGTPNACTGCHLEVDRGRSKIAADKRRELGEYANWLRARETDAEVRGELERLDRWSLAAAQRWWGEKPDDAKHYAYAFQAVRAGRADAERRLIEVANSRTTPSIVRASALDYLARFSSDESLAVAERLLASTDPQIQLGALERCEAQIGLLEGQLDPAAGPERLAPAYRELARKLAATLDAPARAVRHAAARVLIRIPAPVRGEILGPRQSERLDRVVDELIADQATNADRAGCHMLIALMHESRNQFAAAIAAYEMASRVEPNAVGPRGNLAALYDRLAEVAAARGEAAGIRGDSVRAEQIAGEGNRCRMEAKRLRSEELALHERDSRLAPHLLEPQYRYAMSLYMNQREADAERVLRAAVAAHPQAAQPLLALALLLQKQRRVAEALGFAERLVELQPADAGARQLRETLAAEASAGQPAAALRP
jgi:tetratricopeptide (TPR) repeat protein